MGEAVEETGTERGPAKDLVKEKKEVRMMELGDWKSVEFMSNCSH